MKPKPATAYGFLNNEKPIRCPNCEPYNSDEISGIMLQSKKRLDESQEDINLLIIYSFRYCLGRMTYCTHDFYDMAKKYLPIITNFSKKIMVKEIKEYKEKHGLIGQQCDDEIWMKVLDILGDKG